MIQIISVCVFLVYTFFTNMTSKVHTYALSINAALEVYKEE